MPANSLVSYIRNTITIKTRKTRDGRISYIYNYSLLFLSAMKVPDKLQIFLESLPENSREKNEYAGKIKKYKNECGCSMGAHFLFASILFCLLQLFFITKHFSHFSSLTLKQIAGGVLLIFLCGLAGKLTGISIAKARLYFLSRKILTCQPVQNGQTRGR